MKNRYLEGFYMQKFDLWLDESGDFQDEGKAERWRPSLVGGLLVTDKKINEAKANQILGKKRTNETVHFVDEKDSSRAIKVLQACKKNGAEFVIFQNLERMKVIDDVTTYLTVLSEGIVQLLLTLTAKCGEFELDIYIATRKDTVRNTGIISKEEYTHRLQEKIVLDLAKRNLYRPGNRKWGYKISFGDARYDSYLQLADCVCNTYLTQDAKKFDDEQKGRVKELFTKQMQVYSILRNQTLDNIKDLIVKGNYGEALFLICFEKDAQVEQKYTELTHMIVDRLGDLDIHAIKNNLDQVTTRIDTILKYDKTYTATEEALQKIQNIFIPLMKDHSKYAVPEFSFDIALYLYTIYTHKGSVKGYQQDEICLEEMQHIEDMFSRLKCFYKYSNRRSIHLKNMFDIDGGRKAVTNVIRITEQMLEALSLVDSIEQAISKEEKRKNNELAKAYGTRLQFWPLLWDQNPLDEYLIAAESDYYSALENFSVESDKERQHLYFSQIKNLSKDFSGAIALVLKSAGIEYNDDEKKIDEFLRKIKVSEFKYVAYKYLAYFKTMAYAKEHRDPMGDVLYKKLKNTGIVVKDFYEKYNGYPVNMIYWFYAEYLKYEKLKEANVYYDMAIEMSRQATGITIRFILLGILASKMEGGAETIENRKQLEHEFIVLKKQILQEVGETEEVYWKCLQNNCFEDVVQKAKLIG